jgi:uncharacterized membrane protein
VNKRDPNERDLSERERNRLIDDYLGRLADDLADAPAAARRELTDDLRGHIEEAWASSPIRSRAALLNVLDRLGEPEALAGEERERLGLGEPTTGKSAGPLEVAAVALTALLWPVGVLLAWLSPRWITRNKVIATLIPLLGLALTFSLSMIAVTSFTRGPVSTRVVVSEVATSESGTSTEVPPTSPATGETGPSQLGQGVLAVLAGGLSLFGVFGAPFSAALFLALRLRRRSRRAATTMLVIVGFLLVTVVIALSLWMPATGTARGPAVEVHQTEVRSPASP